MGFPRQEFGSWLSFPSPGDLPDPGIKPESLVLAGGFFTAEPPGKPIPYCNGFIILLKQIIHKKHKKLNIFKLTGQYLKKYSSAVQQLAYRTDKKSY